jgi:hypothetical protein
MGRIGLRRKQTLQTLFELRSAQASCKALGVAMVLKFLDDMIDKDACLDGQ